MTNKETIQNLAYAIAELESVNRAMQSDLNVQTEGLANFELLRQEHEDLINDYENVCKENDTLKAVVEKQEKELQELRDKLAKCAESLK